MGVSLLQMYPVKEGLTGTQTIELLTKRVQTLGGQLSGQFLVDCDTYGSTIHSMGGQQSTHRVLNVLHNSEHPASTFALLEVPVLSAPGNLNLPPGSGVKTVSLVADNLFDLLVHKMSHVYTSKKIKIESKGPRFELGDFVVKLGSVLMSQNFKGVLVEVEYRPCSIAEACWELLMEFMQGILGQNAQLSVPRTLQARMKEMYTPLDTIHQYMDQFTSFRKQASFR
ncbi:mediator of RNA polymerase II transcription subunit 20 isoform X2 [Folsomia candida]|uniref:mediator of RNA polymerase II transcription subunit 20 isoform X2 n=1 Tax=Folsomia candida TaxID=158441 RepID=UPI000B8FEBF0|nr:mediator of RNA polymerase II transcription subunit 20 isoform X2 [Folsomia candida]